MDEKTEKNYYVGLDVGTDSVGAACTDEEYKLLRIKGQDAWAVRLFDEANDASARRAKRTARRRLMRREYRIDLLQEIFAPYMEDELFFIRLNNSPYVLGDKDEALKSKYSLFADSDYDDKSFYAEFPTIFHLRQALIEGKHKYDLRLYYLAVHHIIKYRGHFLFEGQSLVAVRDLKKLINELNLQLAAYDDGDGAPWFDPELAEDFRQIVSDGETRLDGKLKKAVELFGDEPRKKAVIRLAIGGKSKPHDVFGDGYEDVGGLKFSELDEEQFAALEADYGEDFAVLEAIKNIYNFFVLEKILGGYANVSQAMVAVYDKHKKDLRLLKDFVKKYYGAEVYKKIFKSVSESANYANYVGYSKPQKKKINVKKCKTPDEFYKFLKKTLTENAPAEIDNEVLEYVLGEIEAGSFLPKILNADGGVFPYQINLEELNCILAALERDYPQFSIVGEDGVSAVDKIKKLFVFRIPYYVGPLNNYHGDRGDGTSGGGNSWVVRSPGRITPWNFDEKVDRAKSNEKFMRRMTSKCSYLHGCDVLPMHSLLYQKFNTLNQLNKLRINEQPISVELKKRLYNELFCRVKKVTDKRIIQFLVENGLLKPEEAKSAKISGKAPGVNPSMSSYVLFKERLGDFVDSRPDVVENVILWQTLNTDKSVVEGLIRKNYGDIPEIIQNIGAVKGMTFKGFGNLSMELLSELDGGIDPVSGELITIISLLYDTNANLNEIINDERYGFKEKIAAANCGSKEIGYADIEALYLSPKVRRGVWQAIQMTDEYVKAFGAPPKKIFVEVTREHQKDKKETVSRKKQLLELYKGIDEAAFFAESLENISDLQLREERLYLYYRQLGVCMYSGERIDLAELGSDRYDVDHIVPQSLTKDDSLENKVLVLRRKNADKSDSYPLPEGFTNQQARWKMLHDKRLIGDKKYALLTRKAPLTNDDFAGFIARQIVETNQSAKAVCELLARKYPETQIVYSKAGNVSDFRKKYNIVKCRETNDLHHARDAYLNIVVGNVYNTKFSNPRAYFYEKNDELREYNLKNLFNFNVAGAWKKDESLRLVKSVCAKNSVIVTRYAFTDGGAFYDETVYPKNDGGISVPRKANGPLSDAKKYGGYKSLKVAYFAVVESTSKGKRIKTIEPIPVLVDYAAKGDENKITEYLVNTVGLKDPTLIVPKLKKKSLMIINGTPLWIAGITGNRIIYHNAAEWFTDAQTDEYVKALAKLCEQGDKLDKDENSSEYLMNTNRFKERKLIVDGENNLKLYDKIIAQLNKPVYNIQPLISFTQKLSACRGIFAEKTVRQQAKVLLQCVKILKCNAEFADLSIIGEGSHCGILLLGKNITDLSVKLVHLSPCGLHKRVQKI